MKRRILTQQDLGRISIPMDAMFNAPDDDDLDITSALEDNTGTQSGAGDDVPLVDEGEYTFEAKTNDSGDHTSDTGEVLVTKAELERGIVLDKEGNKLDKEGNTIVDQVTNFLDTSALTTNTDGAVIDEAGNVLLTKDEVSQGYQIDIEGNLYDREGTIIGDEKDTSTILDKVVEKSGLKVYDNDGQEVTYDATPEGMTSYVTAIHEASKAEGKREGEAIITQMKTDNPLAFEAYEHMTKFNTLEGFDYVRDYSKITVATKDDVQHKSMIVEAEMAKGSTLHSATELADMYIGANKGEGKAKESLLYLRDKQNKTRATRNADALTKSNAIQAKRDTYWNEVKSIIADGKLESITIPKIIQVVNADGSKSTKTADDFYNYAATVVDEKNGLSAAQIALNSLSQKRLMELFYMEFTNMPLSKLTDANAETNKVNNNKNSRTRRKVVIKTPQLKPNKSGVDQIDWEK